MLEETINQVVSGALTLLALAAAYGIQLVARWAKNYFEARIGEANYGLLQTVAVTFVKSLEQNGVFAALDGPAKKAQALAWLRDFAAQYGFTVDIEVLDAMIEEAVKVMKEELSPPWLVVEGAPGD